ncbi:ABC-2 type transport system permease protein [Propionispira arboris]|uniref:ABC-2 type transport system permease protein n=1 Tax=Propionispira arboris TaxID=84035 RepID=A0A1H7AEV1_9FIRM|nr:ABC transporter permease [Propionispira arboris]SEJ59535.1 ABC-2 type transport system permease protein [Propionispira arboris]
MNWKSLVLREVKGIFVKDPRRILFLFGAIWGYLFIFGFLYNQGVVKHIPAVLYDADQSELSRSLVQAIEDSESISFVKDVTSEEAMEYSLAEKKSYMAIEIPKNFAKDIQLGKTGTVLYMANGANIIFANTTAIAVQDTINEFSDKVAIKNTARRLSVHEKVLAQKLMPIDFELRILNNPTQTYLFFFCIGLALAAFQSGLCFAVGASVHSDIQEAVLLKETPVLKRIITKFIVYWLGSMISFGVFLLLANYFWHIPVRAPLSKLMLLNGAFSFDVIMLAMLISSFFATELKFVKAVLLYVVPSFIFSGYTWPLQSMPTSMQWVGKIFFPLTWMASPTRELMLSGNTGNYVKSVIILCFTGALSLFLIFCSWSNRHLAEK